MARMIPNYCSTTSPGEKQLYKLLRDDPLTKDWVVLHSLHIANHVSKAKGEADFVLLIPRCGIAIVEVKSHKTVSVSSGSWFLGAEKTAHESPFVQSERAMFSIRERLHQKLSFSKNVTFLNMCWFTEVPFPKENTFEWQDWQVLNSNDLESPVDSILNSFNSGIDHLRKKINTEIGQNSGFNDIQIEAVINSLRPDFEFTLSEKQVRSQRREELIRFVEDQYQALDLISSIPRIIFKGPAGTGKSLLALEMARRASLEGKKVKLVCFNTLLASYLRSQVQNPSLEISTIDSLAHRVASMNAKDPLPKNPIEALQIINFEALSVPSELQVDLLIIDEAQDTLNSVYFDFLNSLLKGGLSAGKWIAFGDFDSQQIYGSEDGLKTVKERFGEVPVASLSKNCRNVIQIGHFAEGILSSMPKWNSFLRTGENPNPKLVNLSPNVDMVPLLDEIINELRDEYFSWDEIVVLSPLEIPNPADVFCESKYSNKFSTIDSRKSGQIGFSTIGRFKGLETSCVIALDLEQLKNWSTKNELLYILFTRATDRLTIMANNEARAMLVNTVGTSR
jgi:DNA polymerase III delta prime subunit